MKDIGIGLSAFALAAAAISASAQTSTATRGSSDTQPRASQQAKAVCKDGTTYTGQTLQGACRDHGGIQRSSSASSTSWGADSSTSSATSSATNGHAGLVWADDASKVYHCPGARSYGTTSHGEYMSEADARKKGFRPDQGKACAA